MGLLLVGAGFKGFEAGQIDTVGDEIIACPRCRYRGTGAEFGVVTRNIGQAPGISVVDVGFRCPECNFAFGFEALE